MITLNGLEKIYRTGDAVIHALKGITLNVEQGEIFGIIGRAGAGKSALIRCINLLEYPNSGAVIVDSCNLMTMSTEGLRQARRNIGMIFQHFNLLDSRSVFDNVALPLEITGASKGQIEATVRPLLNMTGLADKGDLYPHQLNGGQKQRVAIARALVHQPKVLLCDEATAGLDAKTAQSILQLLSEINERLNLTILLITHDMEVIKSICSRVAVLHQGEIVEQGTVLELFTNPKSEIGKELVKAATRLEMPTALRRRLRPQPTENCHPILRISFVGPSAQEPLLAYVIQQFGLSINITQAHLETVRNDTIGIMVVEVIGRGEEIEKAIQFLEHKGLHIEVLGYAPRTA
jgi:D-methionine transport system ATP-binding protein